MIVFLFVTNYIIPQKVENKEYEIQFGGYINWSALFDSRQTISLREGHFLLFPSNIMKDINGKDINEKSNFNMLSIQTRLSTKIDGPEVLGAKPTGFIEAEFFGSNESDVNGLRLRHAYLNLNWGSTSLLIGQTWHPMFITDAFSQTISFNTGVPFQPFSRNPQIRFTQKIGTISISATASTQRDFTSLGPLGGTSVYLRNSGLPSFNLNIQSKNENLLLGAGVDYKIIVPQIQTSKNISTNESISSTSGLAYFKYFDKEVTVIAQGVYGQNLSDLMMLGGYAVKNTDPVTGIQEFENIKVYSLWTDLTYGNSIQPGVFFGFTKNLGADVQIDGAIYSRAKEIDELLRISPRILIVTGKLRFGLEIEYTKALYGTPDNKAKVFNTIGVSNTRILFGMFYLI